MCASPDRLVSCDCCGEGLLEIKCPKSCENEDPKTANLAYLTKAESAVQQLKRSHMYYTQVQMQMGVVGRQWCDFFVFSRGGYFLERVTFDSDFWSHLKSTSAAFFSDNVAPVLVQIQQDL